MDLTGIGNINEYYSNHYFSTLFEEDAKTRIAEWRAAAKEDPEARTPWARVRECSKQFYATTDRMARHTRLTAARLEHIRAFIDPLLAALGYPKPAPMFKPLGKNEDAPIYMEVARPDGTPQLWALLCANADEPLLARKSLLAGDEDDDGDIPPDRIAFLANEALVERIFFTLKEPPRFVLLLAPDAIALIDRNKWMEKRYVEFDLGAIFDRREEQVLQAMAVLLHCSSLCPRSGRPLLDAFAEKSMQHATEVSQDLKYALRESIELLGNEVLYDLQTRQGRNLEADPVDAGNLSLECLRYMYRMLFILFIESRPELGYAPLKAESYLRGYSLESLRDITDAARGDATEVGSGTYLFATLQQLCALMYAGYPKTDEGRAQCQTQQGVHHVFTIEPLKAHIFDPQYMFGLKYTPMLDQARVRNSVMLRIIDLMSVSRPEKRKNARRKNTRPGRISYANLGINQLGAVYEALLSYRGFIAQTDLYEVKRAGDDFDELKVGYFVPESELDQYDEDTERVRNPDGSLRKYPKGAFIYRLAGREREKSASYYTPESLTRCLVHHALKELLPGKTADEILALTICEPAMGSAAFLNEAVSQLAEAYIMRKQEETGQTIPAADRAKELQKVKMYIADRNVYGIDLNPVAVELAEVSLWLNTIFEGAYVPWFGTQLVNGNSLIGARRQCYSTSQLKGKWYDVAPERVPLGAKRKKTQIYHFLLGDKGMSNYTDKVIKGLAPDKIKAIEAWRKKFIAPYSGPEQTMLCNLSEAIDDLWTKQVELRQTVEAATRDALSVWGHEDTAKDSHTTIRQKDAIYSKLYKSEHMNNAGPYARLKFAMDYWCALWFWPIDKADLLPTREDFLNELSFILVGTVSVEGKTESLSEHQRSLFDSSVDTMVAKIRSLYPDETTVDLDKLCRLFPRLKLVREIAEANKFMHWEVEFADVFAENGGFDLIIGNPPWIALDWEEANVLSEKQPLISIRNLKKPEVAKIRPELIQDSTVCDSYVAEYEEIKGQKSFLSAIQNYPLLNGQQVNLSKCFLPQAWLFSCPTGISGFIHPENVYTEPACVALRKKALLKLKYHFQFINEKLLFPDVAHPEIFSLNIYSHDNNYSFDSISNLFDPSTIAECYSENGTNLLMGLKDTNGQWNVTGSAKRIVRISKEVLTLFSSIFDDSDDYTSARIPSIHAQPLLEVLQCFGRQGSIVSNSNVYQDFMWHETNAQTDNYIKRETHFSNSLSGLICSGPHIGLCKPLNKTPRRKCVEKSDFDAIDLTQINVDYLPRSNYKIASPSDRYLKATATTPWGVKVLDTYRIFSRKMLNLKQERTLFASIMSPNVAHINGITSFSFDSLDKMILCSATFSSLPFDFFIKVLGKDNLHGDNAGKLPIIDSVFNLNLKVHALLLNCLTKYYADLWRECWQPEFTQQTWAKQDPRLRSERFTSLTPEWTWNTPLRTDYERRQALVEIDVLTAMALGMTLDQLKTIYRIQFSTLQSYEADTWYDANGRIVFTNSRSLTDVGYKRPEWEKNIKGAPAGKVFTRTITDDTMPDGPVERTIEYVAPFDRCDREQDYDTVWAFFASKV